MFCRDAFFQIHDAFKLAVADLNVVFVTGIRGGEKSIHSVY